MVCFALQEHMNWFCQLETQDWLIQNLCSLHAHLGWCSWPIFGWLLLLLLEQGGAMPSKLSCRQPHLDFSLLGTIDLDQWFWKWILNLCASWSFEDEDVNSHSSLLAYIFATGPYLETIARQRNGKKKNKKKKISLMKSPGPIIVFKA